MKKFPFCLLVLLVARVASAALDEGAKIINLSAAPDIAIFGRTVPIEGFTLSLWGENPTRGFALGIINGMTGDRSAGAALGIVNYADGYTGAQLGVANVARKEFVGFQGGVVNYVAGTMTGLQWGVVNFAVKARGLQLGFVNYAETMDGGLQIGVANIITQNKSFFGEFPHAVAPAFIITNWRFM